MLPLSFKLRKLNAGDDEFGGMPPFMAARIPQSWNMPFGITDSDIKGPTIPKPILFAINGLKLNKGGIFHPISAMLPMPATVLKITGVTKDETGAAAAGFTVYLFNMTSGRPVLQDIAISDGSGNYSFVVGGGESYWIASYKSGSPDKAGATLNTLIGTVPS